jgi:hypothetical protein
VHAYVAAHVRFGFAHLDSAGAVSTRCAVSITTAPDILGGCTTEPRAGIRDSDEPKGFQLRIAKPRWDVHVQPARITPSSVLLITCDYMQCTSWNCFTVVSRATNSVHCMCCARCTAGAS